VQRPDYWSWNSQEDAKQHILMMEEADPTYEGLVVQDKNGLRYKWKTSTYCSLHHMKDNGNILHPKNLVPIVLSEEVDEVCAIMPEVRTALKQVEHTVKSKYHELVALWYSTKKLETQKEFACKIKHYDLSPILFMLRSEYGQDATEKELQAKWRACGSLILKRVFQNRTYDFDLILPEQIC